MSDYRRPRASLVALCASLTATVMLALTAGLPSGVAAHDPTPRWSRSFTAGAPATYKFGTWAQQGSPGVYTYYTMPQWAKDAFAPEIEQAWADRQTNNSNGPRFTRTTAKDADVTVYWSPDNPVHVSSGWLGSADTASTPRRIWLRKNVKTVDTKKDWCEISGGTDRCPLLARAAIHEIGHIGSLGHSASNSWTDTRMHGCSPSACSNLTFPFKSTTSWNATTIGRCDEAALQLRYDVADPAGPYANCFDHLANAGAKGLKTEFTVDPVATTVCAGDPVVIRGRLRVQDEDEYGPLGGNVLGGRTVHVAGGGRRYDVVTTKGSTVNWSLPVRATNVTYSYSVSWAAPASEGLDSPLAKTFTVRWLSPQVLC